MYKINKTSNNVEKLDERLFKELNIRERDHLQEWIAKNPEMLGEDLLIIQKEFDGFNDTNERLDLLAIDKDGGLVIIENKLDDTGRNVAWQALKYTSYCSTLTNSQIIKMYQAYLDKWQNGDDAKQNLLDFLEISEDELLLNRNDQRIIFVANNYRKEVTSTVLWLIKHDIQIKCFRATPYSMGEDLFLQIEQIIPLPETAEFMIDAKEKQKEESDKSKTVEESEIRLVKFWSLLKTKLAERNINFLERISPKPSYSIGFTKGSGYYGFCIGRQTFRVELYFSNDITKETIDSMAKYKEAIEGSFEGKIEWERLENKKASRIRFDMTKEQVSKLEGKFSDELYWDDLINWYSDAMFRFYNAVNPYFEKIR
ncbi:hypothetical protein FEDK69T_12030 [Flavobacterium enshiense DK69]|uniref:DUF4268 domain-containing protein n=1 Tax=Flavobacterium enshiense DK69 TaxID=1107311 RepID=V6SAV3_9FLAO|nr:DUF4268 domain-containing protein [Flavobacterium enshiense]ESU23793.1 hypothetical protein FEDK69T_12030 [Flavobacterium enshiense DK69]KGO96077.1 hypothetical protein Q767_07390 [Flavobacterium enshiense DK69]